MAPGHPADGPFNVARSGSRWRFPGQRGVLRVKVAFSDLFSRRRRDEAGSESGAGSVPVQPSRVLARFVTALSARPDPVVLDLGPVVGSNVAFFGEQLGCKIIVEDLSENIDRHVKAGTLDDLPAVLAGRVTQDADTLDGILCWDVFDYLDKPAAQRLAGELVRVLRPQGVLLGLFHTAEPRPESKPSYTRHVVVDQGKLEYRPYPAARARQRPLPNREIERLFSPLKVVEQFLLKSNVREVLLRKPAPPAPAP